MIDKIFVIMKLKSFSVILVGCLLFVACVGDDSSEQRPIEKEQNQMNISKEPKEVYTESELGELEKQFIHAGLKDIQSVDSTILVDLKYTGTDNFMKMDLYGVLDKVYLQPVVAERLKTVNQYLQNLHPTMRLIVFDGVRPRSVQEKMWNAMDSIPFNERIKFVSNPKNGSIHNYGAAVDLSIFDLEKDTLLNMGAGYDDLRKIAYPIYEDSFLALGELTAYQIENRQLLRKVMKQGGFWVLDTEWWHFNAYSRAQCKELFQIIE